MFIYKDFSFVGSRLFSAQLIATRLHITFIFSACTFSSDSFNIPLARFTAKMHTSLVVRLWATILLAAIVVSASPLNPLDWFLNLFGDRPRGCTENFDGTLAIKSDVPPKDLKQVREAEFKHVNSITVPDLPIRSRLCFSATMSRAVRAKNLVERQS